MIESINIITESTGLDPLQLFLIVIWTLVWKGLALWKAAELRQKYWFVAILFINTLGILEIFYYFLIASKYQVEIVEKSE